MGRHQFRDPIRDYAVRMGYDLPPEKSVNLIILIRYTNGSRVLRTFPSWHRFYRVFRKSYIEISEEPGVEHVVKSEMGEDSVFVARGGKLVRMFA